jgi:hypothetical protein
MRWWRRQTELPGIGSSLVDETERFLRGCYLEDALADGQDLPSWAWLATLAHADATDLEAASAWATTEDGAHPEYDAWRRVLQRLSSQVLSLARSTGLGLGEVQRDVLVPLELALMTTPVGPATLYRVVSSMLGTLEHHVESGRA